MSKSANTKENLIGTALNLFWSKGFNSVGVEDICKKAGINKGSFYHYFPSKTALAVTALEVAGGMIQQKLEIIFQKGLPLEKLIDNFCEFLISFQKMKKGEEGMICGCPFTSVGMEESTVDREIAETAKNKLELFKNRFLELAKMAVERKLIKPAQAEMKTNELFACYLGTFVQIRLNNNLSALENMKMEFYDILGVK
jgi:TetR/AcrR family transcriptional regulator, transcriptional repressor for nem operon